MSPVRFQETTKVYSYVEIITDFQKLTDVKELSGDLTG